MITMPWRHAIHPSKHEFWEIQKEAIDVRAVGPEPARTNLRRVSFFVDIDGKHFHLGMWMDAPMENEEQRETIIARLQQVCDTFNALGFTGAPQQYGGCDILVFPTMEGG